MVVVGTTDSDSGGSDVTLAGTKRQRAEIGGAGGGIVVGTTEPARG